MEGTTVELFKARDGEESFAIRLPGDKGYRATKGFGQQFEKAWSVEIQSAAKPDYREVDWDKLLDRVIEACEMSDPVLTNFDWKNPQAPLQA